MYGYAHAGSERAKASRLAEIFAYKDNPTFNRETADRMGARRALQSEPELLFGGPHERHVHPQQRRDQSDHDLEGRNRQRRRARASVCAADHRRPGSDR